MRFLKLDDTRGCETPSAACIQPDDTPPKPFGGAAAMRPAAYIFTEAQGIVLANDNTPPSANDNKPRPSVREDMDARLPLPRAFVDGFTGQPLLDGKSKPWTLVPVSYFALNVVIGVAAAATTAMVVSYAPAAALFVAPWTMLLQTSRLRKHQTHIAHEAAHRNFFIQGDPRRSDMRKVALGMDRNDLIGEIASTLSLSPNMLEYRRKHDAHHDPATYTTPDGDPDSRYVARVANLRRALLDPREYARDFAARLKSNLLATRREPDAAGRMVVKPYWGRRAMGAAWLGLLLALAGVMPAPAWLASVFIPYVVLFRVAGILQMLSLHRWNLPPAMTFEDYADRTFGRFSGVPLPKRGLRGMEWGKAWALWWAEILLLELPFRLGVLTSDLQAHDAHHLEWILAKDMGALSEFVDDWRNQPFRRAEMIRDSNDPLKMAEREIWGVRAMWKIASENLDRLNVRRG